MCGATNHPLRPITDEIKVLAALSFDNLEPRYSFLYAKDRREPSLPHLTMELMPLIRNRFNCEIEELRMGCCQE